MSVEIPLRNNHTVFVLGAGFSLAAGMPLMANFLSRMRDAAIWAERNNRAEEASAIHAVLRFRLEAASSAYRIQIDLENIEELFSLASASNVQIEREIRLAIGATIEFCRLTEKEPILRFNSRDTALAPLVDGSAVSGADSLIRDRNLYDVVSRLILRTDLPSNRSIITFNYDLLLESSIDRLGGTYSLGVSPESTVEAGVPYDADGVAIYKIHGSVAWAKSETGALRVFKDYSALREQSLVPELVPPTWNKTILGEFAAIWNGAIEKLSTASRIVVIGFSMPPTDSHFRYLLAAGMQRNVSLREVLFLDPSDQIKDRAAQVFVQRELDKDRVRFKKIFMHELIGRFANPDERIYSFDPAQISI